MVQSKIDRRTVILSSVFGIAASNIAQSQTSRVDSRFSLSDGRCLGYRIYGDPGKSPLLYFHGSPGCRLEAELIAETCHRYQFRLIAIDRPGIGLSTASHKHSVASWPEDIREFIDGIDNLCGAPFRILALSGGTSFALACAHKLPSAISSVAIMSPRTPFAPGVPMGVLDPTLMKARQHPRLARIALQLQVKKLKRNESYTPASIRDFASIDQCYVERNGEILRQTFIEAARCGVEGILHELKLICWPWHIELSDIQVPVGLWLGDCDLSAPGETLTFLQSRIPNSHAVLEIGQGHLTLLENTTERVLDWLKAN